MTIKELADNDFLKKIYIPLLIIVSGLCWYFSVGLNGNFFYLLWLAPAPVLFVVFRSTATKAFFISFLAYLIGRLSWFNYLVTVATLMPAVIFTLLLPLFFAFIMLITRISVIKINSWYTVFAFPVFFTAFELLLMNFSPDGTTASIAYSQSNFLPLIQLASVTGIPGISFIVTYIPSALALGWYYRSNKKRLQPLIIVSFILIVSAFLFGIIRVNKDTGTQKIRVGLVVLNEGSHNMGDHLNASDELQHTINYMQQVARLAAGGARLAVLPERAININKENAAATIDILSTIAKENHITIVVGYTNFKNGKERNSALVIDAEGRAVLDYNKAHLVKGLESQFTPGNEIGLFSYDRVQAGTAICKDMDFTDFIRNYGLGNASFLCIPAWDFVVDDWLHSRMSVLRGVENGFSEVRTARQGRLTISDCYGRVSAEANCSNEQTTSLVGEVATIKVNTLYTRFGVVFEVIIAGAAILFLILPLIKQKGPHQFR